MHCGRQGSLHQDRAIAAYQHGIVVAWLASQPVWVPKPLDKHKVGIEVCWPGLECDKNEQGHKLVSSSMLVGRLQPVVNDFAAVENADHLVPRRLSIQQTKVLG